MTHTEEQTKAIGAAEHEWETKGGPLLDSVEDGNNEIWDAANELDEAYGEGVPFWAAYIAQVLRDRGSVEVGTLTACPKCGGQELKIWAVQYVTVCVAFDTNDDHQVYDEDGGDTEWDDKSDAECTDCKHEGKLGEFEIPHTKTILGHEEAV